MPPTSDTIDILGYSTSPMGIVMMPKEVDSLKSKIDVFLRLQTTTKHRRAQLLGQLQHGSRANEQLSKAIQPLYQLMPTDLGWDDMYPIAVEERSLLHHASTVLSNENRAKYMEIHSDASDNHLGLYIDGKTYSFKPSTSETSSTAKELRAVVDSSTRIKAPSHAIHWHVDNLAARDLIIGSSIPRSPAIKLLIQKIRQIPFYNKIHWIFVTTDKNKADQASRKRNPSAPSEAAYKKLYKDQKNKVLWQMHHVLCHSGAQYSENFPEIHKVPSRCRNTKSITPMKRKVDFKEKFPLRNFLAPPRK